MSFFENSAISDSEHVSVLFFGARFFVTQPFRNYWARMFDYCRKVHSTSGKINKKAPSEGGAFSIKNS